jgi:hypothetical protein
MAAHRLRTIPNRNRRCRVVRDHGVALIAVLWILVLLTLLATTVGTLSVERRRAAHFLFESAQMDATLDSAVRIVLLKLMQPSRRGASAPSTAPSTLTVLSRPVQIDVEYESGRVDLNYAATPLVEATFVANGWSQRDANALALRVADRRNSGFESIAELRELAGAERISPELMDAFTVYSHLSIPLPGVAPPAVRRALDYTQSQSGTVTAIGTASFSAAPDAIGNVMRIRACTQVDQAKHCRVGVVRLTGSMTHPLQIFDWYTSAEASAPADNQEHRSKNKL